ncbi:MAG: hypothetical protein M5R36_24845 [Deltaproteobacteria bacterium]|nr:hypothetical protein [Deltaproteobacteria bacterium]
MRATIAGRESPSADTIAVFARGAAVVRRKKKRGARRRGGERVRSAGVVGECAFERTHRVRDASAGERDGFAQGERGRVARHDHAQTPRNRRKKFS